MGNSTSSPAIPRAYNSGGRSVRDSRADTCSRRRCRFGRAGVVRVAQVDGHGAVAALFRVRHCRIDRGAHAVALRAFADGDNRLCERQTRFRHPDEFHRARRGFRLQHRNRVRQAYILAGMGNNPPRDEFRVNTGINQPCEPRQRRVAVRAAQGLAERAEHVIIQTFVAANHGLLDGFLRDSKGDVDDALCVGGRREHSKLYRTERRAGITARNSSDMAQRIVIGGDFHLPIAALRVVDSAAHGGQHVTFRQRLKLEYAAAADNCGRHGHHRVFRRRADKADNPPLDGGQDAVALRL